MNRKAANFGIALLVIVLIISVVGLVLWFSVKEEAETITPEKALSDLGIAPDYNLRFTLKPCTRIDQSFNCEEGLFTGGDSIYFLVDISNLKTSQSDGAYYYDFTLEKQFRNIDTDELIMDFSESLKTHKKESVASDYIDLKVSNELITFPGDVPGNYEYVVILKDKNSGKEYSQTSRFVLE